MVYKELPIVANITEQTVIANYLRIKKEVAGIVATVLERMLNDPQLTGLVMRKG